MANRDLYIAAYDISCRRRRTMALKVVKGHSTGGQKSVYECFLTRAERQRLLVELRRVIEPGEDRVLLIRLDPRSRVHTLGLGQAPQDPPYFYCG